MVPSALKASMESLGWFAISQRRAKSVWNGRFKEYRNEQKHVVSCNDGYSVLICLSAAGPDVGRCVAEALAKVAREVMWAAVPDRIGSLVDRDVASAQHLMDALHLLLFDKRAG